ERAIDRFVAIEFALGVGPEFAAARRRCALAGIEKDVLVAAGAVQQEESAAAKARALRFDHGEGGTHRDCRVKRVATRGEDFEAGIGGELMRTGNGGLAWPRRLRRCARIDRRCRLSD